MIKIGKNSLFNLPKKYKILFFLGVAISCTVGIILRLMSGFEIAEILDWDCEIYRQAVLHYPNIYSVEGYLYPVSFIYFWYVFSLMETYQMWIIDSFINVFVAYVLLYRSSKVGSVYGYLTFISLAITGWTVLYTGNIEYVIFLLVTECLLIAKEIGGEKLAINRDFKWSGKKTGKKEMIILSLLFALSLVKLNIIYFLVPVLFILPDWKKRFTVFFLIVGFYILINIQMFINIDLLKDMVATWIAKGTGFATLTLRPTSMVIVVYVIVWFLYYLILKRKVKEPLKLLYDYLMK